MSATKASGGAGNLSAADVDVKMSAGPGSKDGSKDVLSSIITQVDRNAPAPVPPVIVRPSTVDADTESRALSQKPVRRSLLQRLFFCCAGGRDALPHQTGATTTSLTTYSRTRTGSSSPKQMPSKMPVLPPVPEHSGKKLLALDLDETLVHSSFQPVSCANFTITVAIEGVVHNIYVIKRPGCDEFLRRMAEHYEIIIYTASLSKYADPLLDILDPERFISKRLFRENCVYYDGHYVKDLSLLNRDITQTIIVDNSPMSYIFHPENAIDCTSFFDDPTDVELWQIADFLTSIKSCADVRQVCKHWREWCHNNPSSAPPQQKLLPGMPGMPGMTGMGIAAGGRRF